MLICRFRLLLPRCRGASPCFRGLPDHLDSLVLARDRGLFDYGARTGTCHHRSHAHPLPLRGLVDVFDLCLFREIARSRNHDHVLCGLSYPYLDPDLDPVIARDACLCLCRRFCVYGERCYQILAPLCCNHHPLRTCFQYQETENDSAVDPYSGHAENVMSDASLSPGGYCDILTLPMRSVFCRLESLCRRDNVHHRPHPAHRVEMSDGADAPSGVHDHLPLVEFVTDCEYCAVIHDLLSVNALCDHCSRYPFHVTLSETENAMVTSL